MKLTYAVVGTGALGGFYGGKLANAGHQVHFLFHSDYQFVKEYGLQVDSVHGNFHLKPVNAYASASQMPACDVVLVCLKTTNNYLLKDLLSPLIHKDTVVILVQNGLGMEQELAKGFPGLTIAGGLAFICSSRIGKGHIAHYDFGNLKISPFQGENEIMEQVCIDLKEAGIRSELAPDLNLARWQKLVWNIPYNGMTVVLNTTTDSLMKQPDSRQMILDLMMEVVTAAKHCKVDIEEDFAGKMMHMTDKMTPYAPSMKVDFDSRRPLEIDAIYTNPIHAAMNYGFEMKKVRILEQQLRFIQSNY
jgi:2-dehydropantoate 2-reductase